MEITKAFFKFQIDYDDEEQKIREAYGDEWYDAECENFSDEEAPIKLPPNGSKYLNYYFFFLLADSIKQLSCLNFEYSIKTRILSLDFCQRTKKNITNKLILSILLT